MRGLVLSLLCLILAVLMIAFTLSPVQLARIVLYNRAVISDIPDDANALLQIEKKPINIPQGSGSVDILRIKNNMPESAVITVSSRTPDFITGLQVIPPTLLPGDACSVHLYYDTSGTLPGDYILDISIKANSEKATLTIQRTINIRVASVAPTPSFP